MRLHHASTTLRLRPWSTYTLPTCDDFGWILVAYSPSFITSWPPMPGWSLHEDKSNLDQAPETALVRCVHIPGQIHQYSLRRSRHTMAADALEHVFPHSSLSDARKPCLNVGVAEWRGIVSVRWCRTLHSCILFHPRSSLWIACCPNLLLC